VVRIVIKGEARLCQDEQRRTKRRPRCIFGLTDRALDIAVGLDLASTGVRRAGGGVAAHVHVVGVERVLEGVVTLGGRVAPGTAQIVEVPAHGIGESAREGRRLRGGEHQHERDKYHKRAPHDEKAGERIDQLDRGCKQMRGREGQQRTGRAGEARRRRERVPGESSGASSRSGEPPVTQIKSTARTNTGYGLGSDGWYVGRGLAAVAVGWVRLIAPQIGFATAREGYWCEAARELQSHRPMAIPRV